ncbi:MAG: hypothetical protein KBT47_06745, partial [Armatimonadetes bacterium]|nr:hypothetical protein [Candidatus Hippobium faecium]
MLLLSANLFAHKYEDAYRKTEKPEAVQKFYTDYVPHTDKNGNLMTEYVPGKSFFQIALWGAPSGEVLGETYDWKKFEEMGFNTVWPWKSHATEHSLQLGKEHNMQIVLQKLITEEEAEKIKDHPNLLACTWYDEPTNYWDSRDTNLAAYKEYADMVRKQGVKVCVNNNSWITEPATEYFGEFDSYGDMACHDNYPIKNGDGRAKTLSDANVLGSFFRGIDGTVSFSRELNENKKPIWYIAAAFAQPTEYGKQYSYRFLTANQIRSQVYTAIIHGATGIIYFAWDSYLLREGGCIGMSDSPKGDITQGKYMKAKPADLIESKMNYEAVKQTNRELAELAPYILSPTVKDVTYNVHFEGVPVSENPIRCLLKPDGKGGYILFTVNMDDSFLKGTFSFDKDIKEAKTMFENDKTAEIKDNAFSLSYEPFESHIIH